MHKKRDLLTFYKFQSGNGENHILKGHIGADIIQEYQQPVFLWYNA